MAVLLQSVHRTSDSLLSYFTEESQGVRKDPKANGLKKKTGTAKFISISALVMDAMTPVTILFPVPANGKLLI